MQSNLVQLWKLITHDNPSKHSSNIHTSLTFAKLRKRSKNNRFTCFYIDSKSCAKQQICAIIGIMCKYSSKKHICLHIWTICKWPSNPWLPIFFVPRSKCCENVAFTVIATDSKSSAISVFALGQIWANLYKCGICYAFAVIWLLQ